MRSFHLWIGVVLLVGAAVSARTAWARGYRSLPKGKVAIWDTGKLYTAKNPTSEALSDKSDWTLVPYARRTSGKGVDYVPRGDLMLENDYFFLFLFTNKEDAVDLMAKMEGGAVASNEIYKVHDTGRRNFGHGTLWVEIETYTPEEIVVRHAGRGMRTGEPLPVVTTYRVQGGKPWLEIGAVERVNQQGMHGKSRICAFVNRHSDERILDGKRETWDGEQNIQAPEDAIGIINFRRRFRSRVHDFMWFLTAPPGFEKSRLSYLGFHADRFWEDDGHDAPSCGAQYVHMKQKAVIGVLNAKDCWQREDVNQPIRAGRTYTSTFEAPYPGKWRVIAYVVREDDYTPRPAVTSGDIPDSFRTPIDGKYHYRTVEVKRAGERFVFKSPVSGTLDYLLVYLLDRTGRTPREVFTPMDVYREAVRGR